MISTLSWAYSPSFGIWKYYVHLNGSYGQPQKLSLMFSTYTECVIYANRVLITNDSYQYICSQN